MFKTTCNINLSYQQRAAIFAYTRVVSHKVASSTFLTTHPKSSNRDVSMCRTVEHQDICRPIRSQVKTSKTIGSSEIMTYVKVLCCSVCRLD